MPAKMKNPQAVRGKIVAKLKTKGIKKPTVRDMYKELGCSPNTLTNAVKGRKIDWSTVDRIAELIGANASDIASEVS